MMIWAIKKIVAIKTLINIFLMRAIEMKNDNESKAYRGREESVPVKVGRRSTKIENILKLS